MTSIIKLLAILLLLAFCACQDEPTKSDKEPTNEKSKISVSEQFTRDLENAKAISESAHLPSVKKIKLTALEDAKNILENIKRDLPTMNQTLIGMWECKNTHISDTKCDLLWKINSDNTYQLNCDCESGEVLVNGTWYCENNFIIIKDSGGTSKSTYSWVDANNFTLTEGNIHRNYSRTYREIPKHIKKVKPKSSCVTCGGYGRIECRTCFGSGQQYWSGDNSFSTCLSCIGRKTVTCPICYGL